MNATELFEAGQLQDAIDAQIQQVKAAPTDQAARLFLFELAAFAGDLDRAEKQIGAINYDKLEHQTAVEWYQYLIQSERLRRLCFAEGVTPEFMTPPPEHILFRLEVINLVRENQFDQAKATWEQANAQSPTIRGVLNEEPFEGLRDANDLCPTFLEVMAYGKYCWVPFEQLKEVRLEPPQYPRDIIWPLAKLSIHDVGTIQAFLPALYPSSWEHDDDRVKLGRMTDWKEYPNGLVGGVGLRLFDVADKELTLLDWRHLEITND
ncbi:MAG: type VI secretion system accessory protein TagJ [Gemmataceae bacterium]